MCNRKEGDKKMIIFPKPREISELKNLQVSYNSKNRDNVRILVIDDSDFAPLERLQKLNFNIRQKKDISNIYLVAEYDVILVDIDGIGLLLNETYQGAYVISEIRKQYPQKVIIAYTSKTYDASYNKYFRLADYVFKKDIASEDWSENLDSAIENAINPISCWKKLRDFLLKKEVSLQTLIRIEDEYVKSITEKRTVNYSGEKWKKMLGKEIHDILLNFVSSLIFKYMGL